MGKQPAPMRWIIVVSAAVILLGLGIAIKASIAVVTGQPDSYDNQHLRLLAGGVSQVLLGSALIATQLRRGWLTWLLIALVFAAVGWNLVLM